MSVTIFLAHASEDAARVHQLYQRLRARGYQPWLDKIDLLPGQDWKHEIQNQIEKSHFCVACLSKASVSKIGFVHKEFGYALDAAEHRPPGHIYLVPLRLDDCEVPTKFKSIHVTDLHKPDGYARLFDMIDERILPEHPPQKEGDWGKDFTPCQFKISLRYQKKKLWQEWLDVLVEIRNPPKVGIPPKVKDAYLVPGGRVPSELRTREGLAGAQSLARTVRHEATETFIQQRGFNQPIKGSWFYVRKGMSAETVKVYSSFYDSLLMERWHAATE